MTLAIWKFDYYCCWFWQSCFACQKLKGQQNLFCFNRWSGVFTAEFRLTCETRLLLFPQSSFKEAIGELFLNSCHNVRDLLCFNYCEDWLKKTPTSGRRSFKERSPFPPCFFFRLNSWLSPEWVRSEPGPVRSEEFHRDSIGCPNAILRPTEVLRQSLCQSTINFFDNWVLKPSRMRKKIVFRAWNLRRMIFMIILADGANFLISLTFAVFDERRVN